MAATCSSGQDLTCLDIAKLPGCIFTPLLREKNNASSKMQIKLNSNLSSRCVNVTSNDQAGRRLQRCAAEESLKFLPAVLAHTASHLETLNTNV